MLIFQGPLFKGAIWTLFLVLTGCGEEIDNRFAPPDPVNPEYERKFEDLEKQVGAISRTTDYHSDDFKLTQTTVLECREYLSLLHDNISSTREDHLPEWQQMFDALTRREAMTDPNFVFGNPGFPTNFYFQNQAIDKNAVDLKVAEQKIIQSEQNIETHRSLLRDMEQRVASLDGALEHINNNLADKFQQIDKVLEEYNGRVRAAEQRMVSVESRVSEVQRNVGGFESRIKGLQEINRSYPIQQLDRLLRTTANTVQEHSGFISELQASLGVTQGEVRSVREDLTGTQQDLTRSVNELRQRVQEIEQP